MYNFIQDINKSEADILWNKKKNSIEKKYVRYVPCSSNIYPLIWPPSPTPLAPPSSFERYCLRGSEVNKKKKKKRLV